MDEFFIIYVEGYREPMDMKGPYLSYDEAIQAHFDSVLEAFGDDPVDVQSREDMRRVGAHQFYLEDDAVRIAFFHRRDEYE